MSAKGLEFIKKLISLDWGPIAFKLTHPEGEGLTPRQAGIAIAKYMAFLLLIYLFPQAKIVPTREIDLVWHHHVLDTSKYAEDCQELFGRFVHHYPYFGLRDESDRQNLEVAFAETQALFKEYLGMDIAAGELLADNSKTPADCEPLKEEDVAAKIRPRVDVEIPKELIFWV
jgi:hypothetical protein